MELDLQTLFNAALVIGLTLGGWLWSTASSNSARLHTRLEGQAEQIQNLQLRLAEEYVRRVDYQADMREVKKLLGEIRDRLADKVDKDDLRRPPL